MSKNKQPTTHEDIESKKSPKITEHTDSIYGYSPSWRFSKSDYDHPRWSVLDQHEDIVEDLSDPTGTRVLRQFSKSIDKQLLDSLKDRESTTWGVLLAQTGGRTRGTNSHHIAINKLVREAQSRASELGIIEDELLSLRLDGTHRVFGILEDSVLSVVWFDRSHEIYPVNKR